MSYLNQYGEWAVVTGASSGIGREIAKQVAARGLSVVVVARRQAEIETLALEIEKTWKVKTLTVAVDLALPESRVAVVKAVHGRNVGLLVNSAGFGSGGEFIKADFAGQSEMVEVNCQALLELTHVFAKRFVEQKRGGIILLSSIVAFQGAAYSANYAATKAYVQSLAEGLRGELKPYGVDVLASAPGPTATGFGSRSGMRLSNPASAETVARQTLDALGRKGTVVPGGFAKFLYASLMTAPRFLRVKIMRAIMKSMTSEKP